MPDQPAASGTHADGSPTESAAAGVDVGTELLRWRSHPVTRGGRRLLWVAAVLIVMPGGLLILYGPFYALLALLILGSSLGTYFLPTDYAAFAGGLESRFLGVTRRFKWGQFRSFYPDSNGVLLSPFTRPSRLENFRGLYLRFDGHQDEVLRLVRERMTPSVGDGASPQEPNHEASGP